MLLMNVDIYPTCSIVDIEWIHVGSHSYLYCQNETGKGNSLFLFCLFIDNVQGFVIVTFSPIIPVNDVHVLVVT